MRLRAGGREALHRDLTGVDIRNVPQTEALARQKAFARRGVDRLVEIIATDGAIPCAHYQYPTIAVTTGEGEGKGFYAHAKTIVPDLKFTGSIVVATSLVDAWECQRWKSGTMRGIRFPRLQRLRELFTKKRGPIKWPPNKACND